MMHNRGVHKYIRQTVAFLLLLLYWSQPAIAVTDDCSVGKIWQGFLHDETTDTWTSYLPEEFFNDSLGAFIPDYDPSDPTVHPYYMMKDTACASNDWSIRFTGYSHLGSWGESLAVIGIDIIGYTPNPSLKQFLNKPEEKPLHIEIKDTTTNKHNLGNGLKASLYKYEMGFDYHDDTIYFYRNGYIYKKEAYHVCKMINPTAYWEKYGGNLVSVDYWDYTNNTEYHEDFSDCSQTQEFPECEPQPELTIEAEFELPNCLDDTLRLKVNSNLLEEFHWEGPNGWRSNEKNPTINYEDAVSGKYLVWGKLDPCSNAVYVILDIKIPKLKKDTIYSVSTCHGDTVKIGDHIYTESGLYTDTLKTAAGCDSIVYTFLDFKYRSSVIHDTICEGSSYLHHGSTLTKAGTYTDTIKVSGCNCDSIVTLHLHTYTIENEVYDTICKGIYYELGDTLIYDEGTYVRKLKTPGGCDSTVTLHLKVTQLTNTYTVTICKGSYYEFGDTTLYTEGYYTKKFKTPEGCDSTVTIHLQTDSITNKITETVCEGNAFTFGDTLLYKAGTYKRTFKTPEGCDSIVTLVLSVDTIFNKITETVCEGNAFAFGDTLLYKAGTYKRTFKTPEGCDSIVTLVLSVDTIFNKITETVCEGNAFAFGDTLLYKAGTYKRTFKTPEGCDSIVTLVLSVDTIFNKIRETVCEGNAFAFGDTLLYKAGTYKRTFKTPEGCDSIVTLVLSVDTIFNKIRETVCEGNAFAFGDTLLYKAGTYKRTFKTPEGCDSIVTLVLSVDTIFNKTTETVCRGIAYAFGDTLLYKAGTYKRTFKTPEGCDSIVTLVLKHDSITNFITETICEGSTYAFGDTLLYKAGTYKHTFKTPEGCDSIVTLKLKTYQITGTDTVTICEGSSYLFGDTLLSKPGKYVRTFKTPEGCDSIVTLRLYTEPIREITTVSMCEGGSYLFGDTLLNEPGLYKRTFKTPDGCDSTVYLTLRTYPIVTTIYDTICKGQEYHFNDSIYTKTGTYKHVSRTEGGCDSTTILRLTVTRPGPPTVIPLVVCKGDSIRYNGHTFCTAGTYRDTLTDRMGCDSMVVYKVNYEYQHDTSFVYRICSDFPTRVITGELFSKDTSFTIMMKFDNYECLVKTRVIVIAAPSVHMQDTTIHLCGKNSTRVCLDTLNRTQYRWKPSAGVSCPTCSNTEVYLTDGQATYTVYLDNGYCRDSMMVHLESTPSPIIVAAGVDQNGENFAILVKDGTAPYYYQIDSVGNWNNSIDFEKLDIGVHTAYVKDDKGCTTKKIFSYYVPVIPAKVMTPNGDGILDTWEIKNLELYSKYTIKIFDRWGKLLKSYHNNYDGWDGTYNGNLMPATDYWYTIVIELNEQEESGHFTLVRF